MLCRNISKRYDIKTFFKIVSCSEKFYSNSNFIMGIETSCDDTGCAIINDKGELLAESLHSQSLIHLRNGGIIPDVAQDLHRSYIESIVSETLRNARLSMKDISAVAVTVKPGLALSLAVGMKYSKYLGQQYNKPIIPIHHMQAHALVARMHYDISFPFLVLLISGGHCLLAVVQDVDNFQLLGQSIDCAPGEIFDKVSRRMKLKNFKEYSRLCGGEAIEIAASKATNSELFNMPLPLAEYKDCNFSFNGLKTTTLLHLQRKEIQHNILADAVIPEINDLCSSLLMAVTRHLVHRTQRAMEFCEKENLIPERKRQFVVSGGVACNNFIFNTLSFLCSENNYNIYRPSSNLCTDNGVMIAWNGLEKFRKGLDIVTNFETIDLEATSPLGESLVKEVSEAKISTKLFKIKSRHLNSFFSKKINR